MGVKACGFRNLTRPSVSFSHIKGKSFSKLLYLTQIWSVAFRFFQTLKKIKRGFQTNIGEVTERITIFQNRSGVHLFYLAVKSIDSNVSCVVVQPSIRFPVKAKDWLLSRYLKTTAPKILILSSKVLKC